MSSDKASSSMRFTLTHRSAGQLVQLGISKAVEIHWATVEGRRYQLQTGNDTATRWTVGDLVACCWLSRGTALRVNRVGQLLISLVSVLLLSSSVTSQATVFSGLWQRGN